jgi:hypothetical protein
MLLLIDDQGMFHHYLLMFQKAKETLGWVAEKSKSDVFRCLAVADEFGLKV